MSSPHPVRVALGLAVVAGVLAVLLTGPRPDPATGTTPADEHRPAPERRVESGAPAPVTPAEVLAPAGAGRPRPLSTAEVASLPPGSHFQLPDDTWLPVLNGAVGAPPLIWEEGRPWSPVVRRKVDPRGYEWYVHEDGTESITQLAGDSRFTAPQPVTNAFHPKKALPILDRGGTVSK